MTSSSISKSLRTGVLTLVSATLFALAPVSAEAATNPIAVPDIQTSNILPHAPPGTQNYVIVMGQQQTVVQGQIIKVVRPLDTTQPTTVFVDGVMFGQIVDVVAVAIATGSGYTSQNNAPYGQSGTSTQLPGGGVRTDIDNGDGSGTTIIFDPNGGPNGGTRMTIGTTDSEGNTTTTTTTTDGNTGATTTTFSTDP